MQELLKGLPRDGFDRIVAEHQADKHSKDFGCTHSLWQLLGEVRATLFERPTLEAELYRRRKERQQAVAQCQPGSFT